MSGGRKDGAFVIIVRISGSSETDVGKFANEV